MIKFEVGIPNGKVDERNLIGIRDAMQDSEIAGIKYALRWPQTIIDGTGPTGTSFETAQLEAQMARSMRRDKTGD